MNQSTSVLKVRVQTLSGGMTSSPITELRLRIVPRVGELINFSADGGDYSLEVQAVDYLIEDEQDGENDVVILLTCKS